MQFWEINLGLEDSPEFTLFFPFFKLFFWFYPRIFSYFFSTSYGIFYSFWKKKHVLPKAFFFSRFCSTFYEDFCFWIKYKHQIFFVFCSNYFWNPGRPKLQVTSQPVKMSILSIKWCILNLIFSIVFFSNLVLAHLVFIFVLNFFVNLLT